MADPLDARRIAETVQRVNRNRSHRIDTSFLWAQGDEASRIAFLPILAARRKCRPSYPDRNSMFIAMRSYSSDFHDFSLVRRRAFCDPKGIFAPSRCHLGGALVSDAIFAA